MKRVSIFSFLLVFVLSAAVFAYPRGHKGSKMHKWWENEEVVKDLNLSEEQLKEINEIHASSIDQFKALLSEVKDMYKGLKEMMGDPKATTEGLTSKHDALIAKKGELKKLKFQKKLKIRGVLTDDQIIKLSEIKKEHWKKHKEGKGCSYKEGKESKEGCSYKDKG